MIRSRKICTVAVAAVSTVRSSGGVVLVEMDNCYLIRNIVTSLPSKMSIYDIDFGKRHTRRAHVVLGENKYVFGQRKCRSLKLS